MSHSTIILQIAKYCFLFVAAWYGAECFLTWYSVEEVLEVAGKEITMWDLRASMGLFNLLLAAVCQLLEVSDGNSA